MSRVKSFDGVFEMPVPGRTVKPRKEGLTMIIDKGLGLNGTQDLLDSAADYIDFIKLTFGTSAFLDLDYTAEKVEMVKDYDIWICPGGTFLEVSVWQNAYPKYLKRCKELGFNAIEVSDGTIEIHMKTRADCIKRAVDMGFMVVSEVGKKDPDDTVATTMLHEEIGHKVMVDLKLFDIPETVNLAVKQLQGRGVTFATVHGNEPILEGAAAAKDDVKILAVTVLTSFGQEDIREMFGRDIDLEAFVLMRARRAMCWISCRERDIVRKNA